MLEHLQSAYEVTTGREAILALVDVLLVSYIIYRALLVIKGTKAVQVLVGVLVVTILYFASKDEFLALSTVNWLLTQFIAYFVLILVIIFQEDLRRGLSLVSRGNPLSPVSRLEEKTFLEEIVKASVMLSEKRIGALMVIERSASLDDYSVEGIPIDARVSKELLFSIFLPHEGNPTHDGAVVIREGRITSAGCFLPLTTNPRVAKLLGTRHRAALGLSELTDAAVVVVSEETGNISVAFQQEFARHLDKDELREMLDKLFLDESFAKKRSRSKRGILSKVRLQRTKRHLQKD